MRILADIAQRFNFHFEQNAYKMCNFQPEFTKKANMSPIFPPLQQTKKAEHYADVKSLIMVKSKTLFFFLPIST